jgi:hypothetical protein
MFTSQRLQAVPPSRDVEVRVRRLDEVVCQLDVRGTLGAAGVAGVARQIDAVLADDVRWLIVDVAGATAAAGGFDSLAAALVATARECRVRRGELIVTGAPPEVVAGFAAYEPARRPALAANSDQAIMILKMLRPKTRIGAPGGAESRARRRATSLTLPRIEPRPTA